MRAALLPSLFLASLCLALGCAPAGDEGTEDAGTDADAGGQVQGCSGTPTACEGRPSTTCLAASGCAISDTVGSCAPPQCPPRATCSFPTDCPTFTTETTCNGRGACEWTGSCAGTPAACSTFGETECGQQAGCSLPAP